MSPAAQPEFQIWRGQVEETGIWGRQKLPVRIAPVHCIPLYRSRLGEKSGGKDSEWGMPHTGIPSLDARAAAKGEPAMHSTYTLGYISERIIFDKIASC